MELKKSKTKLTMLTAYNAFQAELLQRSGVDCILVGDSVATVELGYGSTRDITMAEMLHHAKAVRRGAPEAFIIGDLPFDGIRRGPRAALASARAFLMDAGLDAVKLEWGKDGLRILRLLRKNNIPVVGHVGLTPQSVQGKNGFKVRGVTAEEAIKICRQAAVLEKEGVFALIVECVPRRVGGLITRRSRIPVFGIGAGPDCDGQVLVLHDITGLFQKFTPRFVKRYDELGQRISRCIDRFLADVKGGRFPGPDHSYSMDPAQSARLAAWAAA